MRRLLQFWLLVNALGLVYGLACACGISGRAEANFHPKRRPSVGPGWY